MSLMNLADRFAALLGISCIIISLVALYNIAMAKSSDTLFLAFIILPVAVLSAIFLKMAISIYIAYFSPLEISQTIKIATLLKEKDD